MLTAQHSDSTSSAIQSTHGVTEMMEDTRFFLFIFFLKKPTFPSDELCCSEGHLPK